MITHPSFPASNQPATERKSGQASISCLYKPSRAPVALWLGGRFSSVFVFDFPCGKSIFFDRFCTVNY